MGLENISDDIIAQAYINNMQSIRRVAKSLDMPDATLGVLMFLGSKHATAESMVPFKEICQALNLYNKSNISNAGTRLMKRGLVGKNVGKQKRSDIYLTEEGIKLYESALRSYKESLTNDTTTLISKTILSS